MLFLPEQDIIFIHIPRNGGKSYRSFLEAYGTNADIELFDNHSPVSTACYYLDNSDSYTKISIIRNPYSREISLWRWALSGPLAATDMGFEYWCNWRFKGRPKDASNLLTYLDPTTVTSLWAMHRTPQVYYLVDEDCEPRIDYLGCFEKFEELFEWSRKQWHEKHGYVKHVAYGNPTPWNRKLNDSEMDWRLIIEKCPNREDVLEMIYNFYYWDFETFGYEKDWMIENDLPSRYTGLLPKPTSDDHNLLLKEWPLRKFYGNKKLMLSDALSYRFMPEGKNRGVFLQNTMGFKDIQDVVLREDS